MSTFGDSAITYEIGQVYSFGIIDSLFADLRRSSDNNIRLLVFESILQLRCKSQCSFLLEFTKKTNSEGEQGYELTKKTLQHTLQCSVCFQSDYFEEAFAFMASHRQLIEGIILSLPYGATPIIILHKLAAELDQPYDFLTRKVYDKFLKRKIKKKFDNIIGQIKKSIYSPTVYSVKEQEINEQHEDIDTYEKQDQSSWEPNRREKEISSQHMTKAKTKKKNPKNKTRI